MPPHSAAADRGNAIKTTWRTAMAAVLALACAPAWAVSGTFVLDDGSYSITVEEDGPNLVVKEPNKDSPYAPAADGTYQYFNPNTGSTFYLRVIDDDTLEAGRVPSNGAPSFLGRVDTAAMMAAVEENGELTAIAEHYAEMAQSGDDAQAYSMCAAVAFKRAVGEGAEAVQFAQQTAQLLRTILVGSDNPCPDAILPEHW